jgi:hypothetical protein
MKKIIFKKDAEVIFNFLITTLFIAHQVTLISLNLFGVITPTWFVIPSVAMLFIMSFVFIINFLKKYSYEQSIRFKEMGLEDSPKLFENSDFYPEKLMKKVELSLDFIGTTASKYTIGANEEENEHLNNTFKSMLSSLKRKNGKVRFLLINPTTKEFEDLNQARGEKPLNYNSFANLYNLTKLFPEVLTIRFFESHLNFRYTNLDNNKISFGKYMTSKDAYHTSKKGRDTHQLIFQKNQTNFSLFETFFVIFEDAWNMQCSKDSLGNPIILNDDFFEKIKVSIDNYNLKYPE